MRTLRYIGRETIVKSPEAVIRRNLFDSKDFCFPEPLLPMVLALFPLQTPCRRRSCPSGTGEGNLATSSQVAATESRPFIGARWSPGW